MAHGRQTGARTVTQSRNGLVMSTVSVLGVPIDAVTMATALAQIEQFMREPRLHQIVTANPEFVMRAQGDGLFLSVLCQADLRLADGVGLVWASRWYGRPLPERVPGSELVYHLAKQCAEHGWRLFLLGAAEGVAEEAAALLTRQYPGLSIAGTFAGSPHPAENQAIVALINQSAADILYVAYGAPQQDKWIARNKNELTTVRVALGVGGALDFITGRAIRAPRWVQQLGLEWLHRLIHEPWRWRRMLALPRFALKVIVSKGF